MYVCFGVRNQLTLVQYANPRNLLSSLCSLPQLATPTSLVANFLAHRSLNMNY